MDGTGFVVNRNNDGELIDGYQNAGKLSVEPVKIGVLLGVDKRVVGLTA